MGLLAQMHVNFIEVFYNAVHNVKWNEKPSCWRREINLLCS